MSCTWNALESTLEVHWKYMGSAVEAQRQQRTASGVKEFNFRSFLEERGLTFEFEKSPGFKSSSEASGSSPECRLLSARGTILLLLRCRNPEVLLLSLKLVCFRGLSSDSRKYVRNCPLP